MDKKSTLIPAILFGASGLIGFISCLAIFEAFVEAWSFLGVTWFPYVYIAILYLPDIVWFIGLLLGWKWAKKSAIIWGVLSLLAIISSISHINISIIPNALCVAGAVLLYLQERKEKNA